MKEIYNKILDEVIYEEKMDNGLPVFIMPREDYNRQYAVFAANCGSINLRFIDPKTGKKEVVPPGIAHFLEHKLFEDKEENIFNKFAALGSSTNAYTGFTNTSYLFSSTTNFKPSLINLLDFVQEAYFTDENVNKEKGIIGQEIKMYEDNPKWQVFFNLLQGIYNDHPVRYDIAGTIDSINQINKDNLYLFYNTFYHPSNMVLFIVGNVDKNEIFNLIKENQSKKDFPDQDKIENIFPEEIMDINKSLMEKEMDVSRPILNLGFKETDLNKKPRDLIKQELISNMLLDIIIGKSSDLFQQLYNEDLLDQDFSANYTREEGYGYIKVGGETNQPIELQKRLLSGLMEAEESINEKNYNRIHKQYIGEYVYAFNVFEYIASEFISFYFRGVNLLDGLDIMEEITIENLKKQYKKIFNNDHSVVSIIHK